MTRPTPPPRTPETFDHVSTAELLFNTLTAHCREWSWRAGLAHMQSLQPFRRKIDRSERQRDARIAAANAMRYRFAAIEAWKEVRK